MTRCSGLVAVGNKDLTERVDCVVIGAGVVGLAAAREMALRGRDVLILEAADAIGSGISSRNSEVIHAGMYYPKDSLKARACVAGNRLLRQYAQDRGIAFRMVGKLIVATTEEEEQALSAILAKGRANGVLGLDFIPVSQVREWEPELSCRAALWSPDTGVIDSHGLMLALLAEVEAKGGQLALKAPVVSGRADHGGVMIAVGGAEPMELWAKSVIVAGGLHSPALGTALGLWGVPQPQLCKGNYFSLTGKMPFSRLVYPVPVHAGLGVHYTLDLQGRGRFGPDVEWTTREDYAVDPARAVPFYDAIRRYWPGLQDDRLEPAYAGIRPKISGPTDPAADFLIQGPDDHGAAGVVVLYGIESPGLTASLALAQLVAEKLV